VKLLRKNMVAETAKTGVDYSQKGESISVSRVRMLGSVPVRMNGNVTGSEIGSFCTDISGNRYNGASKYLSGLKSDAGNERGNIGRLRRKDVP